MIDKLLQSTLIYMITLIELVKWNRNRNTCWSCVCVVDSTWLEQKSHILIQSEYQHDLRNKCEFHHYLYFEILNNLDFKIDSTTLYSVPTSLIRISFIKLYW